jgi:tetratricopeptide (TPR) repeat protein
VLHADQDNADALHYLGVMRFQQGQTALAIDLVLRAVELRPDYADAWNNLGNIYLKLSPADAVPAYQAALELRPDHPDALRNLGIALRRLKHHEAAAELRREGEACVAGLVVAARARAAGSENS